MTTGRMKRIPAAILTRGPLTVQTQWRPMYRELLITVPANQPTLIVSGEDRWLLESLSHQQDYYLTREECGLHLFKAGEYLNHATTQRERN